MRLGEILPPIDVLEDSLIDAQVDFNDNPCLGRKSAYDNKEYRNIIDSEKSYTIDIDNLIVGKSYVPAQILGAPIGRYIKISTIDDIEYVKEYNNKLFFKFSPIRNITFYADRTNAGIRCTDTIIFDNKEERDQFFSVLKLSFGDWTIKIENLE